MGTKLRQTCDSIWSTLKGVDLPPHLVKGVRWVERHPRAVLTTSLVLVLAVLLAQPPAEQPIEHDAYSGEAPLFI